MAQDQIRLDDLLARDVSVQWFEGVALVQALCRQLSAQSAADVMFPGASQITLASDGTVFAWSDTPITAAMTTTDVTTGLKGEVVGSVTWTVGDSTDTVQLVLDADIEPPDDWWRLTHPGELAR